MSVEQSAAPTPLAARIREARQATGLSQKKFAQLVGTHLPDDLRKPDRFDVMRWENRGDEPRYETLKAIAAAGDKEIESFFRSPDHGAQPARSGDVGSAERLNGGRAAGRVSGTRRRKAGS